MTESCAYGRTASHFRMKYITRTFCHQVFRSSFCRRRISRLVFLESVPIVLRRSVVASSSPCCIHPSPWKSISQASAHRSSRIVKMACERLSKNINWESREESINSCSCYQRKDSSISPNSQEPDSYVSQYPNSTQHRKSSHRVPQTQSLKQVPPRLIHAHIPRWSFIDDPPHPPSRAPTLASVSTPAVIIPYLPFLHHPSYISRFLRHFIHLFSYASFSSFFTTSSAVSSVSRSGSSTRQFFHSSPKTDV